MMIKIKEIFGYNYYKKFNEMGNIVIYSTLSFAQENQTEGERIEYLYDERNRLIKETIEIRNYYSHDSAYEVYEKNYEYNEFGYRIIKLKTKLIHNSYSDPNCREVDMMRGSDRYPVDVNELISIIDFKTKNNNIISKKTSNLLNNKILIEENRYENNKLIEVKVTDFQENTISQTINIYENDLIKSIKKFTSKNNEPKILVAETKYKYIEGLISSVKNYNLKNNKIELSFETTYKYDEQNRVLEEIKANFEKKEYYSVIDYFYSVEFDNRNNQFEKIIKIEFDNYDEENNQMLIENVSINTFNIENRCVKKVFIETFNGFGYNFNRCLNSEYKYLSSNGEKLSILDFNDINKIKIGEHISTTVEIFVFGWDSDGDENDCLIKKTKIKLSEDDVEIVGSETYNYY